MPDNAPRETTANIHRLPRTVEPERYDLVLAPDLDAGTFSGTVDIHVTVHESTRRIVCNAADLSIEHAELSPQGAPAVPATVTVDEASERATFSFSTAVPSGRAVLHCKFSGVLNDRLRGFYRSTFTDEHGQTRVIATTQMESTDARRAFPCWDEPDRKAVFDVTLVVGPGLAAFSNSPVVEEEAVAGGRRVHFAPTMKMSTYLVAFIVGPLEATDALDVDGVPVRVVHAPGKALLTPYALEVAAHALRFFSAYFAIPYPAEKLDLVAIPDFAFGAMENLGCVTFRETALLVDPSSAARTELERVADVVAHEIAHMWFGDLVTMGWWEGIWLNEAFATFMEVLCVDAFRPTWQRWVSFGVEREAALAVDGLHTTRPIEYPVASPEEADGMFDVLTYQKGGSVLRMLEQYLGPEVFRDGVRRYLTEHAYSNTVTTDLWDALEAESAEPVRTMMDSWILQGGYPLVTLSASVLTQEPFSYLEHPDEPDQPAGVVEAPVGGTGGAGGTGGTGGAGGTGGTGGAGGSGTPGGSAIGQQWEVPVLIRPYSGGETTRLVVRDEPVGCPPTVVVNAGGWGVYRVAYDDLASRVGRLADLEPLERCNLVTDTWALALAGRLDPAQFLTLSAGLGDEVEPGIYTAVVGALGLFDRAASDLERGAVENATRALIGERASSLGWTPAPGEDERVPTLRSLLLGSLGTIGADPAVRAEARNRFDRAATVPIDPDIEGAVLQAVAANRRLEDYDAMLDRYRHPANPQQELRYLTALATFPDVELSLRTFELASSEVRTQNAPYLVATLLANRVGGAAVWEKVKESWSTLLDRFPVNSHSRMLDGARALCSDAGVADDVAGFLRAHPLRSGQRSVEQMLERLRVNVEFCRRNRPRLTELLAAFGPDPEG